MAGQMLVGIKKEFEPVLIKQCWQLFPSGRLWKGNWGLTPICPQIIFLLQRCDLFQGFSPTGKLPILKQFRLVLIQPLEHRPQSPLGKPANNNTGLYLHGYLVVTISRMKMRQRVIQPMHVNYDPQKSADFRHYLAPAFYPSSQSPFFKPPVTREIGV